MIKARLTNLGARIPSDLKRRISAYCDRNGVKLQFFVADAIAEKLADIEQDELDNKIADVRLKDPRLTPKSDLDKYLKSREKNG